MRPARRASGLAHHPAIADVLPDALPAVLAMDEVALLARRQHPQAEAFQFAVADVVGFLSGFERVGPVLVETDIGHGFLSGGQLHGGRESGMLPRPCCTITREKTTLYQYVSTEGALRGVLRAREGRMPGSARLSWDPAGNCGMLVGSGGIARDGASRVDPVDALRPGAHGGVSGVPGPSIPPSPKSFVRRPPRRCRAGRPRPSASDSKTMVERACGPVGGSQERTGRRWMPVEATG